jgi:hypothetical protein
VCGDGLAKPASLAISVEASHPFSMWLGYFEDQTVYDRYPSFVAWVVWISMPPLWSTK